ncbi:hypothetical protein [Streptosporangium sp. NPDC049078]|uniref:WD40 repeat domain-containing protein n=1 Tax=Streptosporangium sp. NPDC049078 TaxID=3155767 RepID=UPI0034170D78
MGELARSSLAPAPSRPDLASSLAVAMATAAPLAASGPPRFFVSAWTPIARFPERSKTAILTPVPPSVHDAGTGRFIAAVPLPPGVESSWKLAAAAPDNRTFLLSGTSGREGDVRFFRVRLDEEGRPGTPEPVPESGQGVSGGLPVLAMSHDGTRFAFADMVAGGTIVRVVEIATGARRDWFSGDMRVSGLSWAPDGRRIAVAAPNRGLGVLDLAAPGSDLVAATRLVRPMRGLPPVESVAYTPDGGSLVYSVGHDIERVPVDGGDAVVLARLSLPKSTSLTVRFALDGTGRHLLHTHDRRLHRVDLRDGSTGSVPIGTGDLPPSGQTPDAAW